MIYITIPTLLVLGLIIWHMRKDPEPIDYDGETIDPEVVSSMTLKERGVLDLQS